MHLKSLQLSGFKSFAQKTTLEFTKGITAIVGPNGSGKSNIADAVRWVMGEQSIKTLRGKKSEDVIFSGSDKKGKLGMAEVNLELDNSDKKMPIDYSELLIARRIYRSGDSEYLINNSKSRLSDINLLLTKANFGHRTYSVIGQGMIDNFLIASPQERKDFFDEASGVKQYQIKKNQALSKLEIVWRNLETLNIKVMEMEPQLRLLTKQVKKLQKRKKIETELQELKMKYYSSYWHEINNEYNKQQADINGLTDKQSKSQSEWKSLEDQVNKITKDNKSNEVITKMRDQQTDLMNSKMKLKEQLLEARIVVTNKIKTNIEQTKSISKHDLTQVNKKLEEINLLHQKLSELLDRENNPELIKKEIFNINKKIDGLIKFLEPYINKEPILKKVTQEKLDEKERQKDGLIKKTEQAIADIDKKIIDIQVEIKKLTEEDNRSRSSLWQIQQGYQKAQSNLQKINSEISTARVVLARIETKRFDLKKEIDYEMRGIDNLNFEKKENLTEQEKLTRINGINKMKTQLEIIGGIDPEIELDYETVKQRYDFLTEQIGDLKKTTESLKKLITELNVTIKKQMEKSFNEINKYFKKYFKILFDGGQAELILIKNGDVEMRDSEPLESESVSEEKTSINFFQEKSKRGTYAGIEIQATPPGKKLKSINVLSGGERALTSIALICAIISSNPSPFVVLDEVDAALDEANSIRFAEILGNLSHKTQFIVITHNRATMEKAKLLYGVTMGNNGISKLISLKLEDVAS